MKREIGDYIQDILEAMDNARGFVDNMNYDEFAHDDKTAYAVIRALEMIGEAVKNIPPGVRKRYPEYPGGPSPECAISLSMNTSG
ncbi:MAG: DUF86 domain-containing protein [Candidatus Omnitrophota bacterium]